jgi:Family of unknown function (DUF6790)
MAFFVWPLFGWIGALAWTWWSGAYSTDGVVHNLLVGTLFSVVSLGDLWMAIGHLFFGRRIAREIGWTEGTGFQTELGFALLGLGIAGVLAPWHSRDFWLATAVVYSAFFLGAASVHVKERIRARNQNPLNAGPILYYDVLMPLILCGLLGASHATR